MFDELYREANTADVLNQNIIVDVLNANGKGGYARKTGELLAQNLSMKYNAANYEKNQEESYIILNDIDRKSTRLNSSHANISYAVFCLKKKKVVLGACGEERCCAF